MDFKENEKLRIKELSNEELFWEFTGLAGGDDYDIGCYTRQGEITFKILDEELNLRLIEIGFLK